MIRVHPAWRSSVEAGPESRHYMSTTRQSKPDSMPSEQSWRVPCDALPILALHSKDEHGSTKVRSMRNLDKEHWLGTWRPRRCWRSAIHRIWGSVIHRIVGPKHNEAQSAETTAMIASLKDGAPPSKFLFLGTRIFRHKYPAAILWVTSQCAGLETSKNYAWKQYTAITRSKRFSHRIALPAQKTHKDRGKNSGRMTWT